MKFTRLGAFTLGVVITAASVGAVSFVNAAGDATLKACANKTTGVMRYISKGSCKKTETSLSWNQMGPQGLSGAAGTNGTDGAAGTKGDTGAVGTNGQNLFVVDATGRTLGRYLGPSLVDSFMFVADNRRWSAAPYRYGFWNTTGSVNFYTDAQCTNRLIYIFKDDSVPTDVAFIEHNSSTDYGPTGSTQKAFVPKDSTKLTFTSFSNLYQGGQGGVCGVVSTSTKTEWDGNTRLVAATEIPMLTYTAPLTIVAK